MQQSALEQIQQSIQTVVNERVFNNKIPKPRYLGVYHEGSSIDVDSQLDIRNFGAIQHTLNNIHNKWKEELHTETFTLMVDDKLVLLHYRDDVNSNFKIDVFNAYTEELIQSKLLNVNPKPLCNLMLYHVFNATTISFWMVFNCGSSKNIAYLVNKDFEISDCREFNTQKELFDFMIEMKYTVKLRDYTRRIDELYKELDRKKCTLTDDFKLEYFQVIENVTVVVFVNNDFNAVIILHDGETLKLFHIKQAFNKDKINFLLRADKTLLVTDLHFKKIHEFS